MNPNQPSQRPPTALPAPSNVKKRKPTKTKSIGELRRVTSLPQVRGMPMMDHIPPSPTTADKRRSKLGYHRINVACGHCRRRKIRCMMPAPGEAAQQDEGRCSNCIRLKKTCEFLPVPESVQHEPKARRSGPPSASNPSSPSTSGAPGAVSHDEHERPEIYHQMAKPGAKNGEEGQMDSGFNGVPLYHEQQHYPVPPPVIPGSWQAEEFTSPTSYSARQSPPTYWSPTQSAHSATYPRTNVMTSMSNSSYEQSAFAPPGIPPWPQQTRSMSLGHVDPTQQHHPYPALSSYGQVQQPGQSPRLPYPGQSSDPSNSSIQPAGAPTAGGSSQPYPYQQHDWQRYQMGGPAHTGGERAAYPYQSQQQTDYYASPSSVTRRESMQPPTGAAYHQQPMYYPPTTQR